MKLKQYQTDTLSLLRRFFEEARIAGPKNAYEAITREPEQAGRLGRYAGAYRPLAGLPNVPYVCLRLPTGRRQDHPGRLRHSHCPRRLDREGLSPGPVAGAH